MTTTTATTTTTGIGDSRCVEMHLDPWYIFFCHCFFFFCLLNTFSGSFFLFSYDQPQYNDDGVFFMTSISTTMTTTTTMTTMMTMGIGGSRHVSMLSIPCTFFFVIVFSSVYLILFTGSFFLYSNYDDDRQVRQWADNDEKTTRRRRRRGRGQTGHKWQNSISSFVP